MLVRGAKAIIVHGGAGQVSAERYDRLRAGVRVAAEVGDAVLEAGGSALDAVVAAVRVLEDDPEFNVIVLDRAEHAFVRLSATMPVAWIDDTGRGDAI